MESCTSWFQESFCQEYLELYAHRDDASAEAEIAAINRFIPLTGLKILDAPCGNGRHLKALQQYSKHAVGLDLSSTLLSYAKQSGFAVNGDIRRLPFQDTTFDLVLNLFTSFGYFDARSDDKAVLNEFYRVLKANGQLVFDFINSEHITQNLIPESSRKLGEHMAHEKREIQGRWLIKKTSYKNKIFTEKIYLYTFKELIELLTSVGFTVLNSYGSWSGDLWTPTSKRVIIIGIKHLT